MLVHSTSILEWYTFCMNFFTGLLIFILTAYMNVTTTLADRINELLPTTESPLMMEEELGIKPLPSHFGSLVPDILRTNPAYQQAALSAGVDQIGATVSEPTEALVNIFCTFTNPDFIRTTTGSGFFIDGDGVILTNAHIAQFLLMEASDSFGETECIVRTGDPATARYEAELLYIPPAW